MKDRIRKIITLFAVAAQMVLCLFLLATPATAAETIKDSGEIYLWDPSNTTERDYSADLPNGQRYEQSYRTGVLMTDNVDSPLYLTHIAHKTGRLFEKGGKGGDDRLIYKWIVLEATDRNGNQIFFMGEHNPPAAPEFRVLAGTGLYEGIRGTGNMGWEPAKRYHDGPDGSVVMNYEFEFYYNLDDPNRTLPAYGKEIPLEVMEKEWSRLVYVLGFSPRNFEIELPNGYIYGASDEEGFLFVPGDKEHPLYGIHAQGPVSIVLGPEQVARMEKGELTLEDCCEYEIGMMSLTDLDGDMLFVVIEARPGVGVSIDTFKGTGKFENTEFYGKASVSDHSFFTSRDVEILREPEVFIDTKGREWPYGLGFDPVYFYFDLDGKKAD